MTQPEHLQPDPAPEPAPEGETAEREFEAIALDELDKENRGWAKSYVATMRERLATEQAAPQPDFVMIAYIKKEIAAYQDLLDRTEGGK